MNPEIKVLITGAKNFDSDGNVEAEIGSDFHWRRRLRMKFPGNLEVFKQKDSEAKGVNVNLNLINTVDIETYLKCVIASEMNPLAPPEFLKAHAIISRGWALGKVIGAHREDSLGKVVTDSEIVGWDDTAQHNLTIDGCHICNDDHCQRYQGYPQNPAGARAAEEAVEETRGLVLKAPDGSLVDARFSKCCGGHTELFSTCWQPQEQPCLEAFPDPYCDLSTMQPADREELMRSVFKDYDRETADFYRWQTDVPKTLIAKRLKDLFGKDLGEITSLRPISRGPSGRISRLEIQGTDGSLIIGKELYIRRVLSESHLLSSDFEVVPPGADEKGALQEPFRLIGRGWGHGVGLCQIGAARMAFEGASFREILAFYYPGSTISSLS